MGKKISIDSATLANKALEVNEPPISSDLMPITSSGHYPNRSSIQCSVPSMVPFMPAWNPT
jgi:hypothetical protein